MRGAGLWIGPAAGGEGDQHGPGWFRFQPPAVVEQASRQDRASELDGDDFPHALEHGGAIGRAFGPAIQDLRISVQFSRRRERTSVTSVARKGPNYDH